MNKRSVVPGWALFAAGLLFIALQMIVLHFMGRHLVAVSGHIKLWSGDPLGADNSQQLTDWYSLTHIAHGILLYGLLCLVTPRLPFGARLMVAMGLEVGWEIIENSRLVIANYRKQALAAAYAGDSILNSLSDTLMMCLGFSVSSRLPLWLTLSWPCYWSW